MSVKKIENGAYKGFYKAEYYKKFDNGEIYRKRKIFQKKKDADAAFDQMKEEASILENQKLNVLNPASKEEKNRLVNYYRDYLNAHCMFTNETLKKKETIWKKYLFPLYGNESLEYLFYENMCKLRKEIDTLPNLSTARKASVWNEHKAFVNWLHNRDILHKNPNFGVRGFAKKTSKTYVTWNSEELKRFLDCVDEEEYRLFFKFNFATGVRKGEALGLKWNCVNFREGEVEIKSQTSIREGKVVDRALKTASSERRIIVPPKVMKELKQWYDYRSKFDGFTKNDYVFINNKGQLIPRETLRKKMNRAIELSGVPKITVHDLRHTMITTLMQSGTPSKTVQSRAGHSQVQTTYDVYTHSNREDDRKAAEVLDQMI